MTARKNTSKNTDDAVKTYTVGVMATTLAGKRNIDATKAAKLVRSKLRANFAAVAAADPVVAQAKSAANDGNRWPAMNADVFAFVTEGTKLPDANVVQAARDAQAKRK